MPHQYVVPQFIDVEDKIIGPVTVRQFVILLVTALVIFILYKLFRFAFFLTFGIPAFGFGVVLAFVKINGQPFHYFLLNLMQTFRKPRLRVWDKELTTVEVAAFRRIITVPPPPPPIRKEPLSTSKLSELTLIVNTGGVYRPEDYS